MKPTTSLHARMAAFVAALAVVITGMAATPTASAAAPVWAPAATATVHPGVMTFTDGAQCTANFVFTDGTDVFIGQAAHCSGTGGSTETNGCTSGSLPLGTPVEVRGASLPGTMVYNSWLAMQASGETDPDACQYNDFALIKLNPADHARVNPSVPTFGGPTGLGNATDPGESVYSYGNSSLRGGVTVLSPKTGISLGTEGNGWTHPVYTATPGVPGDSGSAFLDSTGKGIGVLSTLSIAPLPASNNVSDLAHMLTYMHSHGFASVQLVNGTEAFQPSIVGLLNV